MATGGVRCWGRNVDGELGNGDTKNVLTPPAADLLTDVRSVSVGDGFTCVQTVAGGVRCWGNNYAGELGDGSTNVYRATPATTDVVSDVSVLATKFYNACAIQTAGPLRCWGGVNVLGGSNAFGMGLSAPPARSFFDGARSVALGSSQVCVVTSGGGLRCYGVKGPVLGRTYRTQPTRVSVPCP
jgi:hypothetical protein